MTEKAAPIAEHGEAATLRVRRAAILGSYPCPDELGRSGSTTEEYLTPEQLAQELGISERTLSRWHRLRIGPPRASIGKLQLYPKAATREWLASLVTSPTRTPRARAGGSR
jgi:hypothetical protein